MYLEDTFALLFFTPGPFEEDQIAGRHRGIVGSLLAPFPSKTPTYSEELLGVPWTMRVDSNWWSMDPGTPWRIHGFPNGIFVHMNFVDVWVGKYTSPMDPYGFGSIPTVYDDKAA